jgi:hypothetical protein|tara:strand:+ start:638 stop:1258 length:621 start_codon:yes stop_codon:yes gene_type:complete
MDNDGDKMIQRLENLIERIEDENSWDFGFASSLRDQAKEGRNLSPRQTEILEKIEGNHSDEVLAANKDWAEAWDADKAQRLQIVAAYYYRNGYFQSIVASAMADPEWIPTPKQYSAITGNKFAQAVLANSLDEPKFATASMVEFRKAGRVRYALRGKAALILRSLPEVETHAKGGKRYEVLPVGQTTPVICEERDLKKARKRKNIK